MDNLEKNTNVLHFRYGFKLGGVEKFILSLIQSTKPEDKIKHHILIFNDTYDDFLLEELKNLGCEVFIIKKADTRNPLTVFKIIKILKENKIDVVHSHDHGGTKWTALCRLFLPKLKSIFTVHDTHIINNIGFIGRFVLKKCVDMNIAISKATLKEYHQYSILNSIQIYNGVDIKNFSKTQKSHDVNNATLKIVNVAWLWMPKKGQDILIKALKICSDKGLNFSCDFIGGVYDEYSGNLLTGLVKDNHLENKVNFVGVKQNIAELLPNYDLFVFPSRFEGFGLVIIEAMASKLPVIAADIDAPKELIMHGENGLLFESENYNDLADKICDLYNNREKMQNLAENGYNLSKSFDLPIMCNKYYEIYRIFKK